MKKKKAELTETKIKHNKKMKYESKDKSHEEWEKS